MNKLVLTALFFAVLLIGCASPNTNQSPPPRMQLRAQKLDTEYSETIKQSLAMSKICNEKITNAPHGQLVTNEVLFQNQNSENKLELLASKKKLNSKQIDSMKFVASESLKCRIQLKQSLASVPYFSGLTGYLSTQYDLLYAGLISKELTIGEANRKKLQILQEAQEKLQTAANNLTQDLKADAEKEIALIMQQQNINAAREREAERDRQQLIQQIGRSMQLMVVPPAAFYTPPISNNLNCTSRSSFGTVNTTCY